MRDLGVSTQDGTKILGLHRALEVPDKAGVCDVVVNDCIGHERGLPAVTDQGVPGGGVLPEVTNLLVESIRLPKRFRPDSDVAGLEASRPITDLDRGRPSLYHRILRPRPPTYDPESVVGTQGASHGAQPARFGHAVRVREGQEFSFGQVPSLVADCTDRAGHNLDADRHRALGPKDL